MCAQVYDRSLSDDEKADIEAYLQVASFTNPPHVQSWLNSANFY